MEKEVERILANLVRCYLLENCPKEVSDAFNEQHFDRIYPGKRKWAAFESLHTVIESYNEMTRIVLDAVADLRPEDKMAMAGKPIAEKLRHIIDNKSTSGGGNAAAVNNNLESVDKDTARRGPRTDSNDLSQCDLSAASLSSNAATVIPSTQFDAIPVPDRLSLGAHLSPIPCINNMTVNNSTSMADPMDSVRLALLVNNEFKENLASTINKVFAPMEHNNSADMDQGNALPSYGGGSGSSGGTEGAQENNFPIDADKLDAQKIQDIVSQVEKDPIWDEIIQALADTGAVAPAAVATATGEEKRSLLHLNKSIPGTLSSSTPQKLLRRSTRAKRKTELENLLERDPILEVPFLSDDVQANREDENEVVAGRRRKLLYEKRTHGLKKKKSRRGATGGRIGGRFYSERHNTNTSTQTENDGEAEENGEIEVDYQEEGRVPEVIKVKVIANEPFQGHTPPILHYIESAQSRATHSTPMRLNNIPAQIFYLNSAGQMVPLPGNMIPANLQQQSPHQPQYPVKPSPQSHQKFVIKPPANCYYPMFTPTPIATTASVEPQVEYIIPLPTPMKDQQFNDADITFGDSLSKVLVPHSTKRRQQRSPDTDDNEIGDEGVGEGALNEAETVLVETVEEKEQETAMEPENESKEQEETNPPPSVSEPPEKDVSTDKENSVPRVMTQTPQLTAIVNRKVQCSSTPRKSHVRALFNTPNKNALQSPRHPNTLAKMDGIEGVTTPVTCLKEMRLGLTVEGKKTVTLEESKSAVLTRSAKKKEEEAATTTPTKEAVTPRVPKATMKKRILGGVEKEPVEEKNDQEDDKEKEKPVQEGEKEIEKESVPEDNLKKSVTEIVKQKVTDQIPEKETPRSTRKNKRRTKSATVAIEKVKETALKETAVKKAEPIEIIVPEPEQTNSDDEARKREVDMDAWNAMRTKNWEQNLREQMSQVTIPVRREKKPKTSQRKLKVTAAKGKKKGKKEDDKAVEDEPEKISGGDGDPEQSGEKVDDSIDREMKKFLDRSENGDESEVLADQTTITDQSRLDETATTSLIPGCGGLLPNLDASVVKNDSMRVTNSNEILKNDVASTVGGNQLPNLNPVTPGPSSSATLADTTKPDPPKTALPRHVLDHDDQLTKSLSPKKRILHKTRNSQQNLLTEESFAMNAPAAPSVTNHLRQHISPPSANASSTSFNLSKTGLANDSHLLMETPFKPDLDIIPKTPGFAIPHLTPAAKVFKTVIDQHASVLKCPEIPTPDFAITPGIKLTPERDDSAQKAIGGGSYAKRPTDYSSSGSSYYKPDDSEETRTIEARLNSDIWRRKVEPEGQASGKSAVVVEDKEVEELVVLPLVEEDDVEEEKIEAKTTRSRVTVEREVEEDSDSDESNSSSSSSSSSNSSSSSSSSSSDGEDMDLTLSEIDESGRKLISENGVLQDNKIRFLRGSSATPKKRVDCESTPTTTTCDLKTQWPNVSSSSGAVDNGTGSSQPAVTISPPTPPPIPSTTTEETMTATNQRNRREATKRTEAANIRDELAEKRTRMLASLKRSSPAKKPVSKGIIRKTATQPLPSQQSQHRRELINLPEATTMTLVETRQTSTEAVITTTVTTTSSTKRKSKTPRKVLMEQEPPNSSPEEVLLARERLRNPVKRVSDGGDGGVRKKNPLQMQFEKFFGDISDSETDPTPVKRGELELFRTPKVEEKFAKVTSRNSEGERSGRVAVTPGIANLEVVTERIKQLEKSRSRLSEKSLRTPEGQIPVRSLQQESVMVTKERQESPKRGIIGDKKADAIAAIKRDSSRLKKHSAPQRKSVITLADLPREGSLDRRKRGGQKAAASTSTTTGTAKKATIVRRKTVSTERPTSITDYFGAADGGSSEKPKATFRIPKTKAAISREDGEIVENDPEESSMERSSEIPESSLGGEKNRRESKTNSKRRRNEEEATDKEKKAVEKKKEKDKEIERRKEKEKIKEMEKKKEKERVKELEKEKREKDKLREKEKQLERERKMEKEKKLRDEKHEAKKIEIEKEALKLSEKKMVAEKEREASSEKGSKTEIDGTTTKSTIGLIEESEETTAPLGIRRSARSTRTKSTNYREVNEEGKFELPRSRKRTKECEMPAELEEKRPRLFEEEEVASMPVVDEDTEKAPEGSSRNEEMELEKTKDSEDSGEKTIEEEKLDEDSDDDDSEDDDSGSEMSVDVSKFSVVRLDEEFPSYRNMKHDPHYKTSAPMVYDPNVVLKVADGKKKYEVTIHRRESVNVPSNTATGDKPQDEEEKEEKAVEKKKRRSGGESGNTSTLISVPRMPENLMGSVLNFLHPGG